jgi:hypothetical protein
MTNCRDIFIEFFETSSTHGIKHIVKSGSLMRKIFWIIAVLLTISACSVILYMGISSYLQFEVVTEVRMYKEKDTQFPMITICLPGLDKSEKNGFYKWLKINSTEYESIKRNISEAASYDESISLLQKMSVETYNYQQLTDNKLNFTFDNFLLHCRFEDFYKCDSDDFVWDSNRHCFHFNSKLSNSKRNFISNYANLGFKLQLFLGKARDNFLFDNKVEVIINKQNDYNNIHKRNIIFMEPGKETNVAISRTFVEKKQRPYSECIEDKMSPEYQNSPVYREMIRLNQVYYQVDCQFLLKQYHMVKICDCASLAIAKASFEKPYCNLSEPLSCASYNYLNMTTLLRLYSNLCPLECSSMEYQSKVSIASFPSKIYGEVLKKHPLVLAEFGNESSKISYSDLVESTLAMNIYFENLYYTKITEKIKMDWLSLISYLGGSCGLFIGVSILSFVEIFEFIFVMFLNGFQRQFVQ